MYSNGEPYYLTDGGVALEPDTYWSYEEGSTYDPYQFRFVELQDSAGGLHALIQDEFGYCGMALSLFDQPHIRQITDGKELALVMLAIHG